jgi:hypothetical protein
MRIKTVFVAVFLSAVSLATAQLAPAGNSGSSPESKSKDCISDSVNCDLDATVTEIVAPTSPAFTVLGLSPTNVSKPNSPSELATSLINAFDDNGHFQSGTAIDVVPFLVFASKSFDLGQYTDKYWVRVLSRTSVSFATTKGTSSPDTAIRMATGLRVSIFDLGDPRAAFNKCVSKIDIVVDPNNPGAPISDTAKQQLAKCRADAAKKVWNASSFVIAGAPAWISTDGSSSNLKRNGGGFWASLAYGIGDWGQLTVSARRQTGQNVSPAGTSSDATNAFVLQDTTVAGGAFKFGRSDFNGLFEGLYIGKRTGGVPDSYPEFGFGLEKKLATSVYLELNYRYDITSKQTSGILANLKWSFSRQAKLSPQ